MKIKFTKHPYPESLDADDAPPQLVSFSVSESECEYVYIFYTLDNAAGRAAPARAAGRARGGSGESPDWTKDANCTFYTLVNAAGRAAPARAAGRAKGVYGESPYYFITHFNIFYTLHPSLNRGMGLGVWFGAWVWGLGFGVWFWGLGLGFGVWFRVWI